MNENEEKIYDLISSKSFEELTEAEKTLVLESLGSEDLYENMREANLAAEEAMSDNVAPPPEMKDSVMAAFDEKDEKRGIVWWKYAAAVAALVVGAFVFWPSGNLDREPIAENVERKDSTIKKEQSPEEKLEIQEGEFEAFKDANEVLDEETDNITITLDKVIENIDNVLIAENESIYLEEELMEEDYAFADEAPDFDIPTAPEMEEEIADASEGGAEAKKNVQTKPALAKDLSANDTDSQTIIHFSTSNRNVESAQSATAMKSDFNADGDSFEGISLKDIGGYKNKAYVAY